MESLSDRIASLSPQTVVLVVALLTAARVCLYPARAAVWRWFYDLLHSVLLAVVLVFLLLRPFVVQSFFIPSGSMRPTLGEGDRILVNKWVYRVGHPQRGQVVVFRAPRAAAPDEKEYIKRVVGVGGDTIEVREGFVEVTAGLERVRYTHNDIRAVLEHNRSVDQQFGADRQPLLMMTDAIWLGGHHVSAEAFARAAGKPGSAVRMVPGAVFRNRVMLCESYVAEDPAYNWGPTTVPSGHVFVMGDNRNDSHDSHVWGMLPRERVVGRAEVVFWPVKHLRWIHEAEP